jgi:hypothetical protein
VRRAAVAKEPFTDNPQLAAQVRQLLAERENAVAYEQSTRIDAVDKQLKELGYRRATDATKAVEAEDRAEEKAAATEDKAKAAEHRADESTPLVDPSGTPPQGRTAKPARKVTAADASGK